MLDKLRNKIVIDVLGVSVCVTEQRASNGPPAAGGARRRTLTASKRKPAAPVSLITHSPHELRSLTTSPCAWSMSANIRYCGSDRSKLVHARRSCPSRHRRREQSPCCRPGSAGRELRPMGKKDGLMPGAHLVDRGLPAPLVVVHASKVVERPAERGVLVAAFFEVESGRALIARPFA